MGKFVSNLSTTPEQYSQYLGSQRKAILQFNALSERRIRKEQLVDAQEKRERELVINQVLEKTPELTEKALAVVSIPSGPLTVKLTSSIRIGIYENNLKKVISEVGCDSSAESCSVAVTCDKNAPLEVSHYDDMLCAMCKGGCCTLGADHAFITETTINQKMQEHPELSGDEILDVYLSYAPISSMDNSCINHTETGCALPREWRSDACNRFLYPEVKRLNGLVIQSGMLSRVTVIQRDYTHWNRYALDQKISVLSIKNFDISGCEVESMPVDVLDVNPNVVPLENV